MYILSERFKRLNREYRMLSIAFGHYFLQIEPEKLFLHGFQALDVFRADRHDLIVTEMQPQRAQVEDIRVPRKI